MLELKRASTNDLAYIAFAMRELDKLECVAMGYTPYEALCLSVNTSAVSYVFYDKNPLGAFGVQELVDGGAIFWLLATDEMVHYKKSFMKQSKTIINRIKPIYSYITNVVYAEYEATIKWLTWLGSTWDDTLEYYNGVPFKRFYIRR